MFKLHFGKLTLKMYDKGDRVLRVEIIVNNIEELHCGKRLEKLPGMLQHLQAMVVAFLDVAQAAHLSFVDGQQRDALAAPSVRGAQRTAGVDLQKLRMRGGPSGHWRPNPRAPLPQIWPSECGHNKDER